MSRQRVLLLRVERNVARSVIEGAKSSLFFSSGPVAWSVPLEIGPNVTAQIAFRARISGQDDIVMHREVSAWPLVSLESDVLADRFGQLSTARWPSGNEARGRAFGVDSWPSVASSNSCSKAAWRSDMSRPRMSKDGK